MNDEAYELVVQAIDALKGAIRADPEMEDGFIIPIFKHGSSLEIMLYARDLATKDINITIEDKAP